MLPKVLLGAFSLIAEFGYCSVQKIFLQISNVPFRSSGGICSNENLESEDFTRLVGVLSTVNCFNRGVSFNKTDLRFPMDIGAGFMA